jgi:hypothetical protein
MVKGKADPLEGYEPPRRFAALPLAQLLPAITRPAYRKRSPAAAVLLADWAAIVGPRLAMETRPRKLSGGQLTIGCAGPVALELQHLAAALIERINTHAGERLVERLRFVQDLSTRPAAPPPTGARPKPEPPRPVDDIEPGPLNDALARLRREIGGQ